MKKAIDVSNWQGFISWENVLMDNVQAAILRAGYGAGGIDKKYHRNASECARVGIEQAAYWFMYSLNEEMARKEGEYAVNAVKQHCRKTTIFADLEYDSVDYARKHGVTVGKELATAMVTAFCKRVQELGFIPGVYANPDYLKRYFDMNKIRAAVPGVKLWIASWSNAANPPSGYGTIDVWQYSSKGNVNGINGNVDMDRVYCDLCSSVGGTVAVQKPEEKASEPKQSTPLYVVNGLDYSVVFNPNFYAEKYIDVKLAVTEFVKAHPGTNMNAKLFEHFYFCGMTEHRQGSESFNPVEYRDKYPDLYRAFVDDWRKYYEHYLIYGRKEISEGLR